MKKLFSLLLTAVLTISLCACGNNASGPAGSNTNSGTDTNSPGTNVETIEFKLSSHDPSTSLNMQTVQELCDATYEATEGRVKITLHADSSLGAPTEGLTMLDTGVCDMVWTTTSLFADQFPMCEIFTMPFIGAKDCFALTEAMWDLYEAHPEYYDEFEGYVPIEMCCGGHGVFATTKELNSIEDLKGLTMRVVTGPLNTMAQNIGMNIVTMGPGDLFLSMEKGVIEGFMFNLNGMSGFALDEVSDYVYSFGNSTWDNNILVLMSENAWNKLSTEDQEILMQVWGREGSQKMVNSLYTDGEGLREKLGDRYIQIDDGEFYDALKAEAEAAVADYLAKFDAKGVPMTDAYNFVVETLASK